MFGFSSHYGPVKTECLPSIRSDVCEAPLTPSPKADQVMPRSSLGYWGRFKKKKTNVDFFFAGDQCLNSVLVAQSL